MFEVQEFSKPQALKHYLNGGILLFTLPPPNHGPHGWAGLVGKTLIFTTPSVTVTFVTADFADNSDVGTFAEVQAAITTATSSGVLLVPVGNDVWAVEPTPTNGIALDKDGTANLIFGIGASKDISNVVHDGVTNSGLVHLVTNNGGQYVAVMQEAPVAP